MQEVIKIVHAQWEQENLGLRVCEVEVPNETSLSGLKAALLDTWNFDYCLVKLQAPRIDLAHELQRSGFFFLETQIELVRSAEVNPAHTRVQARALEKTVLEKCPTEDIQSFAAWLNEAIFTTDRIAIDPKFSVEIANRRYRNWVNSAVQSASAELFWIALSSDSKKKIGFVLLSQNDVGHPVGLLGGIKPKYQALGLAHSLVLQPLRLAAESGFPTYRTRVSSNNLNVLRLYLDAGYNVVGLHYVFRRFRD